ncbi:C-5 cytosine-specific DNA methylase, partial [Cladochytrium tenue]
MSRLASPPPPPPAPHAAAIRAVEFFSGIGGLHYGLEDMARQLRRASVAGVSAINDLSALPADVADDGGGGTSAGASGVASDALLAAAGDVAVVAAYDINTIANSVYAHNFGLRPSTKSIERLTAAELDTLATRHGVNAWLLSPPCQPFTVGGKQLDDADERSRGLLRLVALLEQGGSDEEPAPRLPSSLSSGGGSTDDKGTSGVDRSGGVRKVPELVFVENVPGFEGSRCRGRLVAALLRRGLECWEFLVSPMQVGLPNDRRRYYLLAHRSSSPRVHPLIHDLRAMVDGFPREPPQLREFLEPLADEAAASAYAVPAEFVLKRAGFRFDM